MGMRLLNFDYSRPFFYMVTLKRLPHRQALSEIVAPGKCQLSLITRAMVKCIRSFHKACPTIAPIECFSIMPDHIHLLIRITSQSPTSPLRLETIVSLLIQMLEGVSTEITGQPPPLFDTSWHDWIISAHGQLAAFTRYIRENPKRHWLRHQNRHFFSHVRSCTFLEREWHAYGNTALLELPIIEGFRCSRKWSPESPEWKTCHIKAERLGPGCAGIGTFMSPCEKKLWQPHLPRRRISNRTLSRRLLNTLASHAKPRKTLRTRSPLTPLTLGSLQCTPRQGHALSALP